MPIHKNRLRQRGYNQAYLIAKYVGYKLGIPIVKDALVRTTDTTPQKELNDEERKNNLKNAFQTTENIVKYKRILLVDDIYTTGSTADAVTECLYKAGATDVYFMSICIGKGQ